MDISDSKNIFINCPFDDIYLPILYAVVFTVFDCGYIARCSLEIEDSSEIRIEKIGRIISECKYGIHDISRTELDKETKLPRFNMPLELGMFLGAKRFGDDEQRKKVCLILDKASYRYHSFISDIAGQDIQSHKNEEAEAIKVVRNWLRSVSGRVTIPGGKEILRRYLLFKSELPRLCKKVKLTVDEMIYNDYTNIVSIWLRGNPSSS
jgi:hypothetical protein